MTAPSADGTNHSKDSAATDVDGSLPKASPCEGLTPRQKEVCHWICEGKRDREIALILGISYRTVTVHVRAILKKLDAENRTSVARMFRNREKT